MVFHELLLCWLHCFSERPPGQPFLRPTFSTLYLLTLSSSYNENPLPTSLSLVHGQTMSPKLCQRTGNSYTERYLHLACWRVCIKWNRRLLSGKGFSVWKRRKLTQRRADITDGERSWQWVLPSVHSWSPAAILSLDFPKKLIFLCNKSTFLHPVTWH